MGERNHGTFVLFLLSLTLLTILTTSTSIAIVVAACRRQQTKYELKPSTEDSDWKRNPHVILRVLQKLPVSVMFGLFTGLCTWSLLSLLSYHLRLISIGQTTNERVRAVFNYESNPYDKGCCRNWSHCTLLLFCPPTSQLPRDFSEVVREKLEEVKETEWVGGGPSMTNADSQASLRSAV